jgi:aspartate aminotransferase-like enzyme
MDDWKIDVAITGSQKGFMLPAGLACVAVSEKAWNSIKVSKTPKYYWDFQKMRKNLQNYTTSFTPPVSLVRNLNKSLDIILGEGLESVWRRHELLAKATRGAVKALGLELFVEEDYCNILTAVKVPDNIDGGKLVKHLRDKYGVTFTGGQESLKGKIFRIGHLGYVNDFDIIVAVAALERALVDFGVDIEIGKGLTEAQKILMMKCKF